MARIARTFPYLAAFVLAIGPTAAAQPEVRIRAESRVELRTHREAGGLAVEGFLRDDLGAPLANRTVVVRIEPSSGADDARRRTARTDERGRFAVTVPSSADTRRIDAEFEGDATHDPTEASRALDRTRADVRLTLQVPEGNKLALAARSHQVLVWARSDAAAGGAGLTVELRDELDRLLGRRITDAMGRARFEVPSSRLGPAGPGRLEARTPGDDDRAAAQTEVPVVRLRRARLTLQERTVPGGVELSGVLRDASGPLTRRAVGLFTAEQHHVATVLTGDDGRYRRRLSWDDLGDRGGTLHARFDSDTAGRTSAVSDPITLPAPVDRPVPWTWLSASMAVTALLLWWLGQRRAMPGPARPRPPQRVPAGIEVGPATGRAAEHRDLAIRVCDHRNDRAIEGAMVILAGEGASPQSIPLSERGRFEVHALPDGRFGLRVEAEGFAPVEGRIDVPHRGEWSQATVRMESYRALALEPFRALARRWLPALRWELHTDREVARKAHGQGAGPAFDRLATTVEQIYYGPDHATQDDLAAIERNAQQARSEPSETGASDGARTSVDGGSNGFL